MATNDIETQFRDFLREFAKNAVDAYIYFDAEYDSSSEKNEEAAIESVMSEDYLGNNAALFVNTGLERPMALFKAVEGLRAEFFTAHNHGDRWRVWRDGEDVVSGPTLADVLIYLGPA